MLWGPLYRMSSQPLKGCGVSTYAVAICLYVCVYLGRLNRREYATGEAAAYCKLLVMLWWNDRAGWSEGEDGWMGGA